MPFRVLLFEKTFLSAWNRMIHLWKPLAGWTLIIWFSGIFFIGPFLSIAIKYGVLQGNHLVVANFELIDWLMSPDGWLFIFFTALITITVTIFRFAGIFQIVRSDMKGDPVSIRKTGLRIIPCIPDVFKFSAITSLIFFLFVTVFVSGIGLIYIIFLVDYDINYYLTVKPDAWYVAIITASVWFLTWLSFFIYITGRSLLSLPAYLDGHTGIRKSLTCAWKLSGNRTTRLLKILFISVFFWIVIRFTIDGLFLYSASTVANWAGQSSGSLRPLLFITVVYLGVSQILTSITGFLGFSFVSTILTKFYFEDTNLHRQAGKPPGIGVLSARVKDTISNWLKPYRFIPALIVLLALSYFASFSILKQLPKPGNTTVIAHRGGPPPAPENTIAALKRTLQTDAEIVEIDVQRTLDGVIVAVHDADLMRVAGQALQISETGYDQLKNIVKKSNDSISPEFKKIAMLSQFLKQTRNKIKLLIEIKQYGRDPGIVDEIVDQVRLHEMSDQVMIMSASIEIARLLAELETEIPVGFVSSVSVGDLSLLPVDFLAVNHRRISPDLINAVRSQEMKINAWTVNNASRIADLIEMDVDGIITDDPALALRVQNELLEMTVTERLLLRFQQLVLEEDEQEESM